eukprot:Gb_07394 [translate_table: standard]
MSGSNPEGIRTKENFCICKEGLSSFSCIVDLNPTFTLSLGSLFASIIATALDGSLMRFCSSLWKASCKMFSLSFYANLGLGRVMQSADFIGMAAWLFLQTTSTNYEIQAELARCFGQLYILQKRWDLAMQAFSEQTYYSALEHGVLDTRTSVGFYNLFRVLKALLNLSLELVCYLLRPCLGWHKFLAIELRKTFVPEENHTKENLVINCICRIFRLLDASEGRLHQRTAVALLLLDLSDCGTAQPRPYPCRHTE